jgi:GntR family transcriptional regulator
MKETPTMLEFMKDKRSLSLQLRDRLYHLFQEKYYRVGDQLPSEEALVQMFGVSRATVREALKLLEEERIITVRHGLGRFLAIDPNNRISEDITHLESVTEMAGNLGLTLTTEVVSFQTEKPGPKIAAHLAMPESGEVFVLHRIRKADGEIIIYSIDIFPRSIVPSPVQLEEFQNSLLAIMEDSWGARLAYSRAAISAILLNDELVDLPQLDRSVPWILMEQINFDAHNRPILYSRDFHRGDKFQFHVLRRRR